MLYISRSFGTSKYGVVDTDDDVETIIDWAELCEAVLVHGLSINGVSTAINAEGERLVTIAEPYQDMRYYTQAHIKAKTLLGVDIVTYKHIIVRITVDGSVAADGVRIRLSEFGSMINGKMLIQWINNTSNKFATLVLDDNITVYELSPTVGMAGFYLDIREVSDEHLVSEMYKALVAMVFVPQDKWDKYLMDLPERNRMWRCLYLLDEAGGVEEDTKAVLATFPDVDELAIHISEMYKDDFLKVATGSLGVEYFSSLYMNSSIGLARHHKDAEPFKLEDYDALKKSFIGMFHLLRVASNVEYSVLRRFENYILYFDVADDIKEIYIKLCTNFMDSVKRCLSSKHMEL